VVQKHATSRRLAPGILWRLFRYTLPQMVRVVANDPALVRKARIDLAATRRALQDVRRAQRQVSQNRDHLDHFLVALAREENVHERLLFAACVARGLKGPALRTGVRRQVAALRRVRALYERVWLAHNKRPNIEVSLAVYDDVIASWLDVLRPSPRQTARFRPLPLAGRGNVFRPEVANLPLAPRAIHGVPFVFPNLKYTHVDLDRGQPLRLAFDPTRMQDLHLLCGGQTIDKDRKRGKIVLEVRLERRGKTVFAEKLEAVRHICDWWAPRGEHMWAGGGLKYVDPKRVQYAWQPGIFYGLCRLSGFRARGLEADTLVIRRLAPEKFYLFAATLQTR
jgi:hypothetical protein